ncbi:MAG: cysteine desulfurase [Clostridiales bacterium]|nr:cysteine desulfurase [Clostridiales bacterium]
MIYLDNAATTKPLQSAVKNYENLLTDCFFNPSSTYGGGIETKKIIERSREKILKLFPANYEVIFTAGGTEADNTAIFNYSKRGNIVTSKGEHSAVFESFNELKKRGLEVRFANLNEDGSVNKQSLLSLIDDKTTFVSIVHVNNETGAINDINDLSKSVKKKNSSVVFHSDGVQAFGKIPYSICDSVDMYSISAHKIGGLKGTGALIKKKRLTISPYIFGGGQENGMRSGTENVFGISIFGDVAKLHYENIRQNYQEVKKLKQLFVDNLDRENVRILSGNNSSPYVLSLSAEGLKGEVIMHMLEDFGVIIGTGSACSSRHRHSRILKECGYRDSVLDGALRVSFIDGITPDEVIFACEKLNECVKKLKGIMG